MTWKVVLCGYAGDTVGRSKNLEQSILSVRDFGPIAQATVELRPFTVFVGPSNTGKSYLAILLYALHQFFGAGGVGKRSGPPSPLSYLSPVDQDQPIERLETARTWLQQALDFRGGQNGVDVTLPEEVAAVVRPILGNVGGLAPWLHTEVTRCFGVAGSQSLIRHSGGKPARVTLRTRFGGDSTDGPCVSYDFIIGRSQQRLTASMPADLPLRIRGVDPRHIRRHASLTLLGPFRRQLREIPKEIADLVFPYIVGTVHRPAHYLPADRAGVMHAHRVVVSSLIGRASRAGLGVESPLPALSGVLADFLERLIDLGEVRPRDGATAQLAERLEADILGGAVRSRRSAVGYPSFLYQPANWKTNLALMNTSSMVSELAPVVLYLRHVVRPGDVLIIEEPESHLHPAMQVAFTRLLAAVVRSGVRVVVTTHSEWVLETLANLVRLSSVDKSGRTKVSPGDVALTPDQVGTWLFEPKKRPKGSVVKEIPLDVAGGTFPAGFDEVTEALYNNWAEIANLIAERGE